MTIDPNACSECGVPLDQMSLASGMGECYQCYLARQELTATIAADLDAAGVDVCGAPTIDRAERAGWPCYDSRSEDAQ